MIAHDWGATLIQWIEDKFLNLENQVAERKEEICVLKEDTRKFMEIRNMYLNARERTFLVFLRDRCVGYQESNKDRLEALNVPVGNALAGATMFLERRSASIEKDDEKRLFKVIYGLDAENILELGKFCVSQSKILLLTLVT